MQPIFNNPVFSTKPRKIYGTSLKWYGSDREQTYDPHGNLYGPDDIDYTFNKNGFRCDEFIDSNVRIAFLGCSVTEAIGVKKEEGWAYQILEMIRKDTNLAIPYWNLSIGGCGLDAIVRAYYHYHNILRPHIVFAFLPGYRREIFVAEHIGNVPYFAHIQDDSLHKHAVLIDPRAIHYETEKNLAMLDLMLVKYGTLMIWNGWGYEHYPTNFHHRYMDIIDWDMRGRDKMHPGPDSQLRFATKIYSQYREKILLKIKSISCDVS
jgi:hypothetical protein